MQGFVRFRDLLLKRREDSLRSVGIHEAQTSAVARGYEDKNTREIRQLSAHRPPWAPPVEPPETWKLPDL